MLQWETWLILMGVNKPLNLYACVYVRAHSAHSVKPKIEYIFLASWGQCEQAAKKIINLANCTGRL